MSRTYAHHYTRKNAFAVGLAAGCFAVVMAVTIFFRASFRTTPNLVQVIFWQLLVWIPWIGIPVLVNFVGRRRTTWKRWLALHTAMACAIAAVLVLWSSLVSSYLSPYYGVLGTKYGAFAYFFIFWFFIDFFAYWLVVAFFENREVALDSDQQKGVMTGGKGATEVALPGSSDSHAPVEIVTARKNGKKHVIQSGEIDWVEAQGYYAALHVGKQVFLIRKSLRALSDELGNAGFVRIHRSTLVNLRFVQAFDANGVTLADGVERRASQEGRKRLRRTLAQKSR